LFLAVARAAIRDRTGGGLIVNEPDSPESHGLGGEILIGKRYLIHDRDPLFTAEFLNMITDARVKSVKLPPRSPNLNAYAERFVRSIKESCLNHMIFFGEESLRAAIQHFVAHYHSKHNHQGLANQLISQKRATSEARERSGAGSA
jgi:transposase InsO family protein